MKKTYRKVVGFLLLGVTCLVAGCQSLLPSGFKKSSFRAECRWLELPYHFQCDYYATPKEKEAVKPEMGPETSPSAHRVILPRTDS